MYRWFLQLQLARAFRTSGNTLRFPHVGGEKIWQNKSSERKHIERSTLLDGLQESVIERENNVSMENENNACKHPDVFANGRRRVRIEEHNDVDSLMYDVDGLNVYSQSKTGHNSKGKEVVDMIEMHDKDKDVENSAYASPINSDCNGMYALCMLANECSSPTPLEKG
ncbi:hypothetical protein GOP47_0004168 [Adiantum capillus-veneris]|uniref:Uncharacterized protein n=1 Tax=Adiantum capillus-veneris TaxID=13818 RepID=A0A9D4V710_ADICA|nr:hypothetical protein GOP47_0004168 [Adiantum capillus-veneris]